MQGERDPRQTPAAPALPVKEAGLPVAADGSGLDALAKALVISGDEATLSGRPAELLANGLDELMVHPLPLTNAEKERGQLLKLLTAIE